MDDKRYAWVAFGMAALCVCAALVYAIYKGFNSTSTTASQSEPPTPPTSNVYYPQNEVELPVPSPPAPPPQAVATPPSAGHVTHFVQVYPSPWSWSPAWHDRFWKDYRWGNRVRPDEWHRRWAHEDGERPWRWGEGRDRRRTPTAVPMPRVE